ncbi:MAG TPA: hypothetical protein V6C65_02845, partial [Allocoleopsis sp.]
MMDSDTEKVRALLAKTYATLPPIEQLIVQLCSVLYEPVARVVVVACFNYLTALDRQDITFTNTSIKPYFDRLLRAGVFIQQSGYGAQCHPLLTEIATRDAIRQGRFERLVQATEKGSPMPKRWKNGPYAFNTDRQLLRAVRIGIYRNNVPQINQYLEDYYKYSYQSDKISIDEIYQQVCNNPFDPEWFSTLSHELYEHALLSIINYSLLELTPADEAFSLLQQTCTGTKPSNKKDAKQNGKDVKQNEKEPSMLFYAFLAEQLIFRGKLTEAEQLLEHLPEAYLTYADSLWGGLIFLRGEDEKAIERYTMALQALKKGSGKRKIYFQSVVGVFFILALLKQGSPKRVQEAVDYTGIARQSKYWLSSTYEMLENLLKIQQGELSRRDAIVNTASYSYDNWYSLDTLFRALCLYWVDADRAKKALPKILEPFCEEAKAAGYDWLAMEAAELLGKLKPRSAYAKQAASLRQTIGSRSLVELMQPQET